MGRGFERLAAVTGTGLTVPERPTRVRPRRHRRSEPPVTLIVKCGTEQHRVSLPSRGPIVLLDHPDRQLVEAMLARREGIEGCLLVLRYVRGRAGYNPYGWYKWLVHVAPTFGRSGSAIRDRLKEFDERRKLRRLLRDVDLGSIAGANIRSTRW